MGESVLGQQCSGVLSSVDLQMSGSFVSERASLSDYQPTALPGKCGQYTLAFTRPL